MFFNGGQRAVPFSAGVIGKPVKFLDVFGQHCSGRHSLPEAFLFGIGVSHNSSDLCQLPASFADRRDGRFPDIYYRLRFNLRSPLRNPSIREECRGRLSSRLRASPVPFRFVGLLVRGG